MAGPSKPDAPSALKERLRFGLWNHYFFSNLNTRLALPWTRLFVALHLSPNAVSLLSMALSFAAAALIALDPGPDWTVWLGGGLMMLGLVWDHSDGQVARLTGRGSPQGALLDTIIDRWVEVAWITALAVGPLVGTDRPTMLGWPAWGLVLLGCWAVHAQLYVRWANIQQDLYVLQKELRLAPRDATGLNLVLDARPAPKRPNLEGVMLPIALNRDTTFWLLFALTLVPAWDVGLLVFAALHTAMGLRRNQRTFRELRGRSETLRRLIDPEYHK